jgi:hypothetical protein
MPCKLPLLTADFSLATPRFEALADLEGRSSKALRERPYQWVRDRRLDGGTGEVERRLVEDHETFRMAQGYCKAERGRDQTSAHF